MEEKEIQALENAMDQVFNRTTDVTDEMIELCKQGEKIYENFNTALELLSLGRKQMRELLTRIGDASADENLKKAIHAMWSLSMDKMDDTLKVFAK